MVDEPLQAYVPRLLLQRDVSGPTHWQAEGTLVFADISGFTRLTEKLSRQGKAGAEEIVRTISAVFTSLLAATVGDGGDVLKFSGDALLLFHDGPDHAHRACHAALTMQRVLRDVGGIDSSRGRVRLRMSVGVHSGTFAFFLCGGEHLELYVLGPAASTTVATEATAGAGEVLVSSATAAALPGAARLVRRSGACALGWVPPLPPLPTGTPPARNDPQRFIAPPLRARLDQLEHEHRRATVGFAHFGGVDDLLVRTGPDEVFARVQQLTQVTMTALERYGVLLTATDVGSGGGTLMLTAGAPDAGGDEEARMLRVARHMVDADCGLPVRIGVNAGDLFVGPVGAPFRRTYSTMGAATNLAARVTATTGWDRVLATAAVTEQVRGRFDLRAVPAFTVKGRDAPVTAAEVHDATGAEREPAEHALGERMPDGWGPTERGLPFVGRSGELGLLRSVLASTRTGRGAAVEIVGDPGVGKSRLIAELRATAGDVAWLAVSCDPYERTSPYQTASVLLRRVLRIPADAGPHDAGHALHEAVSAAAPALLPWLPLLAVAIHATVAATSEADDVAAKFRRVRTQQAVGDLLAAVVDDPAVVVIDDAQHMDDASAELIAALLARLLPARPVMVVVARTDEQHGLHAGRGFDATQVHLAPLDDATATDLVTRLAEHTPVPVHRVGQLVERSAGNPLFLAALVAAQTADPDELPRSVGAIIAARIDGLDPRDRRALRYLSVLGDRFDADLLDATLAPLGVDSRQDDRWRRLAEFVRAEGQAFAFRNALVREVAYEGLTFRRRRELHARVADAMARSAGARAAQLPLHLVRAERWAEAWDAARAAATVARDGGANAVAGELYDMALRAARRLDLPDGDVAATAMEAGQVWERAGVWQRALEAYGLASARTRDPAGRLLVTLHRARTHEAAGRYPQALRMYRHVATSAARLASPDLGRRCLARAAAGYASVRLDQGRPGDAVAHARDAAEHARAAGDDETLAQAYHLLARAHLGLGDHDAAAAYRDRALPVFAALGDLAAQGTVLYDLGAAAQRAGKLDEALWLYEGSHGVRTRAGDVVRAAESANALGEVLMRLGRPAEAHERFSAALRAWRGARSPQGVVVATGNLGVVALRRGDPGAAVGLLEEAVALATRIGGERLHERVQVPLAEALLALGRHVEAWDAATQVLDAADPGLVGAARRVRGEALLRTGGAARAREELILALAACTSAATGDGIAVRGGGNPGGDGVHGDGAPEGEAALVRRLLAEAQAAAAMA